MRDALYILIVLVLIVVLLQAVGHPVHVGAVLP